MKRYEIDMSHGSAIKNMIKFAVPLMCTSILQLLFNAADIMVVGKFEGEIALAAVGSNTSLINLIINICMGYSTGAAVVIARRFGAGNREGTQNAVNTSITVSVVFGILLMFVGILFGKTFLRLMSSPPEVIDSATLYLRVYFLGMPALMIYNFGSAVLRAVGDTRRPLYYLTLSGVVNVALNLFFVIVLRWGVAGVAAATALSQTISAFLVIRCLILTRESYSFNPKKMKISKNEFLLITKIGLPAGIQGSLFSISNVTVQSVVNSFGAMTVAANAAASNLEGFVFATITALREAVLTFTGQNFGAGKLSRIKKGVFAGLSLQVLIVLPVSLLVLVFAEQLLGLYADSGEVIQIAIKRLLIISTTYFICGFNEAFVAALRGLGKSVVPMLTSVFGICVLRLVYVVTVYRLFNTLSALYYIYPISWIITSILNGILLLVMWRKIKNKGVSV